MAQAENKSKEIVKQVQQNYILRVLTDSSDHKAMNKFYIDYKPDDFAGFPAFIISMDRLISDFRTRYNPKDINDGDVENLKEKVDNENEDPDEGDDQVQGLIPKDDDDEDDEDDKEKEREPKKDREKEDKEKDDNDQQDKETQARWQLEAASIRWPDDDFEQIEPISPFVALSTGVDNNTEKAIRDLFKGFSTGVSFIVPDFKDNTLLIGTTVTSFSTGRIHALEKELRSIYPNMEMLKVLVTKSRIAFRLQL